MINTSLLSAIWRKQLAQYDAIYVGFSGGLDSTVLLHTLAGCPELLSKLAPIHIHHGLSPSADDWQVHCATVCKALSLSLKTIVVHVNGQSNIEEAARTARYGAFADQVKKNQCLLTAHHQDDQVETLLLHLFRGAGVKGLSGIAETQTFKEGILARPFLGISRSTLLTYATSHHLSWIEDESNTNIHFSRNFLRHDVLPLLQTKWPGVVQNLARTSRLCRVAQANLDDLAVLDYPTLNASGHEFLLAIDQLLHLSESRCMNVLRYWLHQQGVRCPSEDILQRVLDEVIYARIDADPLVNWDEVCIKRYEGSLYLLPCEVLAPFDETIVVFWEAFPEPLILPAVGVLSGRATSSGLVINEGDRVEIRFRQGGERFRWHGQSKSLKKLMQSWLIPPWRRARIPLLYVNDVLAAVVGYAVSELYCLDQGYEIYFNPNTPAS